jgi:hypothetical protein
MNRRMRTLAGSFALAAMALSVAESVLASVCAPTMEMSEMDAEASPGSQDMVDMAGMPMPADNQGPDRSSRFDECPLGPALGQGCLALASLPGNAPLYENVAENTFGRRVADKLRPDLLLSHALFRPPRA